MKDNKFLRSAKEKALDIYRIVSEKVIQFVRSCNITWGELAYLALIYVLLLTIGYFVNAVSGFVMTDCKTWPEISCIGRFSGLCLFLMLGHFLCKRNQWYSLLLLTIHFAALVIVLVIYLTTGTFFCESILYLVYDTTWEGIKGFISTNVTFKSVLCIIGVCIVYFVPLHFIKKLYKPNDQYTLGDCWLVLAVLLGCIPFFVDVCKSIKENKKLSASIEYCQKIHPINSAWYHIELYNKQAGEFTKEMQHRKAPYYVDLQEKVKKNPPIGILVIGESATRSHLSIYGYKRNTTPYLLKEKKNIIAFDDMITIHPTKIIAMKYWLTDMTLDNRHVKWTIFDALKKAGYRVDVITNQNKTGLEEAPLQMIFSTADSVTYINKENSKAENRSSSDGNVIKPFKKLLETAKNDKTEKPHLIVIHLSGSHKPFHARYPQKYTREFLDDSSLPKLVNEYDTSVHYTDFLMGKMLDELKKIKRPTFMIYFSGYGSKLDNRNEIATSYEIPFLIWTNEKYRSTMPLTYKRIKKAKQLPLQADKAHYGLLEMTGLRYTKNMAEKNFLSDKYKKSARFILEGEKPYKK